MPTTEETRDNISIRLSALKRASDLLQDDSINENQVRDQLTLVFSNYYAIWSYYAAWLKENISGRPFENFEKWKVANLDINRQAFLNMIHSSRNVDAHETPVVPTFNTSRHVLVSGGKVLINNGKLLVNRSNYWNFEINGVKGIVKHHAQSVFESMSLLVSNFDTFNYA